MGRSPQVIPPLASATTSVAVTEVDVWHVIHQLEIDVMDAQNNLLHAKTSQSMQANKHRSTDLTDFPFKIGGCMRLSTVHQWKEFKSKGEKWVGKFMPWYDGLYTIIDVNNEHSTITLNLPNAPNIFLTFYTSEVLLYIESDTELFPSCKYEELLPIETEDGTGYYIEWILDVWWWG